MNLAIEERVRNLLSDYDFNDAGSIDDASKAHLLSLLGDGEYVIPPGNSIHSRFNIREGEFPSVDFFSHRNISSGGPGVSHVRIELGEYDDAHNFVESYNLRMRQEINRKSDFALGGIGACAGGVFDFYVLGVAKVVEEWNPSAWLLVIPPLVMGGAVLAFHYIKTSREMKERRGEVDAFLDTYKDGISTGESAILNAFGLETTE
jgi:hypothetical protein